MHHLYALVRMRTHDAVASAIYLFFSVTYIMSRNITLGRLPFTTCKKSVLNTWHTLYEIVHFIHYGKKLFRQYLHRCCVMVTSSINISVDQSFYVCLFLFSIFHFFFFFLASFYFFCFLWVFFCLSLSFTIIVLSSSSLVILPSNLVHFDHYS